MVDLAPIERRVVTMLLAGAHSDLEILRQQFEVSHIKSRDFTGIGFFSHFEVRGQAPALEPRRRVVISDVCAEVAGLEFGCGFVLFVDDGLLSMLECHLWGDDLFPGNARYTRLYYIHQPNPPGIVETDLRDMRSLKAKLESW